MNFIFPFYKLCFDKTLLLMEGSIKRTVLYVNEILPPICGVWCCLPRKGLIAVAALLGNRLSFCFFHPSQGRFGRNSDRPLLHHTLFGRGIIFIDNIRNFIFMVTQKAQMDNHKGSVYEQS